MNLERGSVLAVLGASQSKTKQKERDGRGEGSAENVTYPINVGQF